MQGYLGGAGATGFFDASTAAALERWKAAEGVAGEPGSVFGTPSRTAYAKARLHAGSLCAIELTQAQKHSLPAPDSRRVFLDTEGAAEGRTCVDVCADFAGQQDCQTRCVRRASNCASRPLPLTPSAEPSQTSSLLAEKRARCAAPHFCEHHG